jgi:glutamate 5-kinase
MLHLTNTLDAMIKNNIVPIINENDALAVEEIKVGDNDTLAALVAPMINADLLVLFSDIDGLYDKNPKLYNDARLIRVVDEINCDILKMGQDSSTTVGTGGMKTKLSAAVIATSCQCDMVICNSSNIVNLFKLANGNSIGTLFKGYKRGIKSREHWIIFNALPHGSIIVDKGVKAALEMKRISLLPKGIKAVRGEFRKGSVVDILDESLMIIGKGITNYSSLDINKIKGMNSEYISNTLGYEGKKEIVHANDLVKITKEDSYYEWFINKG